MQLDTVKDTVSDHQTEVVAAVAVVAVAAMFVYFKKKDDARAKVTIRPVRPNWFVRWIEYRRELKLAKLRAQ